MKRLLLLAFAVVVLAAPAAQAGVGTTLSLRADKTALKFDKKLLTAKAGVVTIIMRNPAAMPHNVAIRGNGVKVVGKVVLAGGTSTVRAKLKKGTYTFYCSVPGHEAAGMKGKLVVT